jgi:hypothetical protein
MVFSTRSCCHCGLCKPRRCALIPVQATFSDSAEWLRTVDNSTDWDVRAAEASPWIASAQKLPYLHSNPHYAAGWQIVVTLRLRMAFAHIKRQGSVLSFHRPAFPFGFWYILWPGWLSAFNPLTPAWLNGLSLLSLGLCLGITGIPFMNQSASQLRLQIESLVVSFVA